MIRHGLPWGLIFVLAAACTAAHERGPSVAESETASWRTLLLGGPCAAEVTSTVADWGALDLALPAAPPEGHRLRVRIPTDELGRWIVLDMPENDAPSVTLVTAERAVTVTFTELCAARAVEVTDPTAASPEAVWRFTDADLRDLLATETGGVIVYVWSPHMPLSVDGWAQIREAAAALHVTAVPVLVAGSDRGFAAAEADRGGIPEQGLREIASVELLFRDAQVHAPTVVVFHRGRVSTALPGYRDADGYTTFVERFMAGASGPSRAVDGP